jgi:5-methylcytosine-specific restriction endonuclease McrA
VNTCPYCTAIITRNKRTCGALDCIGADSLAWLEAKRAAHLERLAERRRVRQPRRILPRSERLAIFYRDDWTCHICGVSVDPVLSWPDPMSAVIDHVTPLALGGTNDHANLATAHAHCNNVKSAREGICVS